MRRSRCDQQTSALWIDTRGQIRELALTAVSALMSDAAPPMQVMEYLMPGLKHRNPKIKVNVLGIIEQALDKFASAIIFISCLNWCPRHGAASLTISKMTVDMCALVSDPNAEVREAAGNTVVQVFRHVGERFRTDIEKRDAIPMARRTHIFQQFDALVACGGVSHRRIGISNIFDDCL